MSEAFTFGIPLIARASSDDWRLVEALLGLTLASLRAQTETDFRVVIAGHERPGCLPADDRILFIAADWAPEAVRSDNLDSGRKKHLIGAHAHACGGGLLMFVDADDWIDVRLVETARSAIAPGHIGGIITRGFTTDLRRLRYTEIPHQRVFTGEFHRVCGSSTIARLRPADGDPLRRDPHTVMHEHYRWLETAQAHGAALAHLSVTGNYVINTAANHSEIHGPFAEWRRAFADDVAREGRDVDDGFLAIFGLSLAQIRQTLAGVSRGSSAATSSHHRASL